MDATIQSLNYLDSMPLMMQAFWKEDMWQLFRGFGGVDYCMCYVLHHVGPHNIAGREEKPGPQKRIEKDPHNFEAGPLKGAVLVGRG